MGFTLACIAAALLIFSAGAQNVSYGWALGAMRSEFMAIVLAMASAGATLMAPVCFAAVVNCWRRRMLGVGTVALALGTMALLYAATCSLGTVAGSRDAAITEHLAAATAISDRRDLIVAAKRELATLKGARADIVERRSELTAILVELSKAGGDKGTAARGVTTSARPDAQAAALGFYIRAAGWQVADDAVGTWLNLGMVLFLELAAALGLTVAAALYPATRESRSEGGYSAIPLSGTPANPEAGKAAVRPPQPSPGASKPDDKGDDDPPPPPPRGKAGRKPTVLPSEAIERLRAKGGKANGSMKGVGKLLGTRSKTAAHRLLHRLAETGAVRLESSPSGVSIAVA